MDYSQHVTHEHRLIPNDEQLPIYVSVSPSLKEESSRKHYAVQIRFILVK